MNTSPVDKGSLSRKPDKDIWLFGGGELFRTLVDAKLVDTIEVGVMPVLLSQGVPILPTGARVTGMKLEKCETLPKSGIVMLTYILPPAADGAGAVGASMHFL